MKKYNLKIRFKRLRETCGWYHYDKNLIEVNKNLSQAKIIETLYHEFTHFVIDKIINDSILGNTKNAKVIALGKKKFEGKKFDTKEHIVCKDIEKYCTQRLDQFFRELIENEAK